METKSDTAYKHNQSALPISNEEAEATRLINEVKAESLINFQSSGTKSLNLAIDTTTHPTSLRHASLSPTKSGYSASPSTASPKKIIESPFTTEFNSSGVGKMIMRKKSSIAFYINHLNINYKRDDRSKSNDDPSLLVDVSQVTFADIALDPLSSPRSLSNQLGMDLVPSNEQEIHMAITAFPRIKSHLLRPAKPQLKSKIDEKSRTATIARQKLLMARRSCIQRTSQTIKFRLLVHDSRQRLNRLKLQAKNEYAQSSVQYNREILMRRGRERLGVRAEHAKRVILVNKMQKLSTLRRALSESFVGFGEDGKLDSSISSLEGIDERISRAEAEMDIRDSQPTIEAIEYHSDYTSNYIFNLGSPTRKAEGISASIRRTKSLPSLVLVEGDDATFLELLDLLPPITRFTLRELEIDEMLGNAQLRHDIIFDPDLQFKTSDSDGEDAVETALAYWAEISDEIESGKLYRIPLLLTEIRTILIELLPNGLVIKDDIMSKIDTNHINQQIERGIMDPQSLITYVAELMKTNCAPIRDVEVDKMVNACSSGDIASSLQICFKILEFMKLDYANHQLSRLRPYIIEHSVAFEWKFFKSQIDSEKIKLINTTAWLDQYWKAYKVQVTGSPNPSYDLYPEALMGIISKANDYNDHDIIPETLKMDTERLVAFFNSWQDITILATILIVFKQAAGPKCTLVDSDEAKTKFWILLNDSDSTMTHITLEMSSLAGKVRGTAMSLSEQTTLENITEKTLLPDSKLYDLIQVRVGIHLRNHISQNCDEGLMARHGLIGLKKEISDLGFKIRAVADFNRAVFASLYTSILNESKLANI